MIMHLFEEIGLRSSKK